MYLFIFCLVVHFVNEVDLWDPSDYRVHDRAAETAKLIDIIQKADKFEVKYPLKSNHHHVDENDADIFETMKLLQKNYDINRKFNIIPKKERLQYISNPVVLETYKNLGNSDKAQTEAYDDLDIYGSTLRSYVDELTNFRYFRTNDKKRTGRGSAKNDDKDEAETKEVNKRRHIGEKTESEDKGSDSDSSHSPENSEAVNKYNEAFNLVKPIVAEMLSKYVVKDSTEKDTNSVRNGASRKPVKRKLRKKENFKTQSTNNDEDTQTEASESNKSIKRLKKMEMAHVEKKVIKDLISGEQKNLIKLTKNSQNTNEDDRNFKKKLKKISTENFNIDPTITVEHNDSEEITKYSDSQNHNKIVERKLDANIEKHDNENVELKKKETKVKEEKEIDKSSGRVSMEEHIISWSDYDENKKTNKQDSKFDDETTSEKNKYINKKPVREKLINKVEENSDNENKKRFTSIENKKESDEHDEYNRYKTKVSTKRKGDWDEKDDKWDQNYDDKKDDTTFKKKNIDWNKKDDSQKSNDWKPKNKRIEKDDYDLNNKKKDKWNKKDDDWNKSNDKDDKKNDDWDKRDDDWNKKDDKWNKKDDGSSVKEEKKKIKKSKSKYNDHDGNLKRDSAWDSVGTNNKPSSGWGSYDSFKNVLEEKNKNIKHNARPVDVPKPKMDIKLPKPSSWDSYDRERHYNKPKKQGRMGMHRTPIPIVGKRPLYAD